MAPRSAEQEISQFGRRRLKPVVFVLNNSGYLIERLLCKDPDIAYNDVASWHYTDLPKALGCDDWFTARVTTCDEFDQALKAASRGEPSCLYRGCDGQICCLSTVHEASRECEDYLPEVTITPISVTIYALIVSLMLPVSPRPHGDGNQTPCSPLGRWSSSLKRVLGRTVVVGSPRSIIPPRLPRAQ